MTIRTARATWFALALLAGGCRSRPHDDEAATRMHKPSPPPLGSPTTAALSVAARRDLALVEKDPPGASLVGPPPADYESDGPNTIFERDGKDVRLRDNLDVRHYAREWLPDQARVPPVPVPLATRTVLDALRRLRRAFSRVGPGGLPQSPIGLDAIDSTLAKWPDGRPVSLEDRERSSLTRLPLSCTEPLTSHFSDVVFHYYCLVPPFFRACHQAILAEHESLDAKGIHRPRREAIDLCLKDPARWSDLELAAYPKAVAFAPAFKAFHDTQWVGSGETRANVFDYLLLSQTYAFDYDHQQAVLNVFYGEQKSPAAGAFDPAREADCQAVRPARPEDDVKANHCDPAALKARGLWSVGR